ncbi:MAG: hypothetical protein AAGF98_01480 [Cyanobacteria bacterium P01_H01_bin.153]
MTRWNAITLKVRSHSDSKFPHNTKAMGLYSKDTLDRDLEIAAPGG